MFERFTRAAREVVHNAVQFAGDRGDPRIGTEHLLAGVAATSSPAADLLDRMGAGSQQVRTAISDLDRSALAAVGIDQDSIRLGPAGNEWLRRKRHIPFNRAAKAVLEGALHQAVTMKHRSIGSEHILAALTATGSEDPARRILVGLGIDVALLHREALTNR
ncbi:MAG: Clp protease N-terminal domain-containing protein [Acidimicrobiia bacterium]